MQRNTNRKVLITLIAMITVAVVGTVLLALARQHSSGNTTTGNVAAELPSKPTLPPDPMSDNGGVPPSGKGIEEDLAVNVDRSLLGLVATHASFTEVTYVDSSGQPVTGIVQIRDHCQGAWNWVATDELRCTLDFDSRDFLIVSASPVYHGHIDSSGLERRTVMANDLVALLVVGSNPETNPSKAILENRFTVFTSGCQPLTSSLDVGNPFEMTAPMNFRPGDDFGFSTEVLEVANNLLKVEGVTTVTIATYGFVVEYEDEPDPAIHDNEVVLDAFDTGWCP